MFPYSPTELSASESLKSFTYVFKRIKCQARVNLFWSSCSTRNYHTVTEWWKKKGTCTGLNYHVQKWVSKMKCKFHGFHNFTIIQVANWILHACMYVAMYFSPLGWGHSSDWDCWGYYCTFPRVAQRERASEGHRFREICWLTIGVFACKLPLKWNTNNIYFSGFILKRKRN